jgi:hypothetical protein
MVLVGESLTLNPDFLRLPQLAELGSSRRACGLVIESHT